MVKKTHSLTLYLVKESINQEDEIIDGELDHIEIDGIGKLYFKKSHQNPPSWIKLFEGHPLDDLFSSSASALLLMNVQGRFFALSFGPAGRHFLQKAVYEERFGLIVTLNSVKSDSLRSIDTKTLESAGIQTRTQSASPITTDGFGINVEKDLVRSVTGLTKDDIELGHSLSGKDSLRVSVKCDLNDLSGLLEIVLTQFNDDSYKTNFPWIDKLKEVTDLNQIAELNSKLVEKFNQGSPEKLWLTVPEILDWPDHGGFKYSKRKNNDLLDDLHIDTFKEHLAISIVELSDLTDNSVYRFSLSNEYQKDHWKIYECIYFEHSEGDSTCFLTGGKWYEVKNSLVQTVNEYYGNVSNDEFGIDFTDYNHEKESKYNDALAEANDAFSIDADLIPIEGRSTFEFCDVYTKNKQLIHVKRYSRSSVLSHLFNQGLVSATFLLDREFRDKINEKLGPDYRIEDTSVRPNTETGEYTVIYGIISKPNRSFEIPFFSKLTLMHVAKNLTNLGFKVSLVKIKNIKPDKEEDS